MSKYENIEIKELENSEIEITGSVTKEAFSDFFKKTLENAKENMEAPGFRKGKAPESVVLEKVGENKILNESAQNALSEVYPEILKENKIDAIGQPKVSITKIAKDNPLEFKIATAVSPKIELSDYKKDASEVLKNEKEENLDATEEEVNEVIENIKKARDASKKESSPSNENTGLDKSGKNEENDKPEKTPSSETKEESEELTDDFVKTLGNFENVEDFKTKIKENITEEKKHRKKDEKRIKMLEKIIENSKIEIPDILTQSELEKIIGNYKDEIENKFGYKFEDYLKQIQKTEDELRESLKPEAEKRAKFQIILNNIAEKEEISVPEEEVSKNVETIMKQYPNADKNAARIYVDTALANEKVYQILENNNNK